MVLISQLTAKQRMKKVLPVLIHSHLVNIESLKQLVLPDMILRREIMNSKSINMEKSFTRKNTEMTNNVWTLTHQNRLKAFDLTVHKKKTTDRH